RHSVKTNSSLWKIGSFQAQEVGNNRGALLIAQVGSAIRRHRGREARDDKGGRIDDGLVEVVLGAGARLTTPGGRSHVRQLWPDACLHTGHSLDLVAGAAGLLLDDLFPEIRTGAGVGLGGGGLTAGAEPVVELSWGHGGDLEEHAGVPDAAKLRADRAIG